MKDYTIVWCEDDTTTWDPDWVSVQQMWEKMFGHTPTKDMATSIEDLGDGDLWVMPNGYALFSSYRGAGEILRKITTEVITSKPSDWDELKQILAVLDLPKLHSTVAALREWVGRTQNEHDNSIDEKLWNRIRDLGQALNCACTPCSMKCHNVNNFHDNCRLADIPF